MMSASERAGWRVAWCLLILAFWIAVSYQAWIASAVLAVLFMAMHFQWGARDRELAKEKR